VAQFAVLITYREIFKKEPSLADLHAILGKYQRREVIFLLAKLNCLLGTWQNAPRFDLDVQLSDYLLSSFRQDLRTIRLQQTSRVVFSRLGILFLMKQACLACREDGLLLDTRSAHSELGVCLLMTNDLVLPFVPSASDGILEKMVNVLPFSDYVSHDHYPIEIGRTHLIFDEISKSPSLVARSDFLDLRSLFQEHFDIDEQTFCELIFGCASKFLNLKLEDLESNPEMVVLRSTYFSKSKVPQDTIARFLTKMTVAESVLVEKVKEWKNRTSNDLTIFQAFPLIEIVKDVYVCLDPGFIVDKSGRSLYWSLFGTFPQEQRGKLAGFWGTVFESYVNYILQKSYSVGGTFIPEPKFSNGDAAFDACIVEGRNLLVFEHKSSVIRADAKYGGDAEKLKKELELKFVEGDEEGAKGLTQLNNHLARFLSGDKLAGIRADDIDRVYPVMICLESAMVGPYLAKYLNGRFDDIYSRKKYRQVVTPVFTLAITDVENLLGYLQSFPLSDILESYYSTNKAMFTSLSSSVVPLLKKAKPQRNIVSESFEQFSEKMAADLFGETLAEPDKAKNNMNDEAAANETGTKPER
jgi:hypothetical protein